MLDKKFSYGTKMSYLMHDEQKHRSPKENMNEVRYD